MSFTTKKYTLNYLINEIKGLSTTQTSSVDTLANNISPRAGRNSAKFYVLNRFLNGNLNSVVAGRGAYRSYGKTAKTRLLKALSSRKN